MIIGPLLFYYVYAEVARTATTITVKFTGAAASGVYGIFVQNVA